ncbi:hypothetical protein D3C78_1640860 [compost metagenome]
MKSFSGYIGPPKLVWLKAIDSGICARVGDMKMAACASSGSSLATAPLNGVNSPTKEAANFHAMPSVSPVRWASATSRPKLKKKP